MALKDADVFYQRLSRRMEHRYLADISEIKKELDEVVLNRLVDRILIGEVRKEGRQKYQGVKIIYNFVRKFRNNGINVFITSHLMAGGYALSETISLK